MISGQRKSRTTGWAGLALTALLCLASVALAGPSPLDWCPEVGEELRLYRAGEYTAVQPLCLRLVERAADPVVRRDADALYALALLRSAARADRTDGMARLRALARDDPELLGRPECELAVGIAQTALSQTSRALDSLASAAEGFAARRESDRQAEALVALADGWSRHAEWETTPPRFHIRPPESSERGREIRREQVAAVRDRLGLLPDSADALARVDLILAVDFIDAGDRVKDGVRVLAQIAAAPRLTPTVAEASRRLAQYYERQQQWPEALAFYQRLASQGTGEPAQVAQQRVVELTSPQIDVQVPDSAAPEQPVCIHMQIRNVDAVDVEVRSVSLGSWLTERQGRFVEATLPEAGSVQWSRRLETHLASEYAVWRSDSLPEPLELSAPPGAYVVVARPVGPRAQTLVVKRLLVVTDLRAAAFVGPRRAVIWASLDPGSSAAADAATQSLTAKFWMHGSFVPTEPRFENDLASFELPPESRLLRSRRWVCLVQAGARLALCNGELPAADEAAAAPAVATIGGPPQPCVGQTLDLAGFVLAGRSRATRLAGARGWQLELRNTLGKALLNCPLALSPAGVFFTQVPMTPELEREHLYAVVRCGPQTAENVRGRFGVEVAPADTRDLIVECQAPPRLDPEKGEVPIRIQAWYPWGAPLRGARVRCVARGVRLPAAASEGEFVTRLPVSYELKLDESGTGTARVGVADLELPPGPRAIAVWTTVSGWEDYPGYGYSETLLSSAPVHAWLTCTPLKPEFGQRVQLELGWCDPESRSGLERPRLEVQHAGQTVAELATHADVDGLRSEPWLPPDVGDYEVVALIPRLDDAPVRVTRTLQVQPASQVPSTMPPPQIVAQLARRDDRPGVQVQVTGRVPERAVLVALADDPLAACALPGSDGLGNAFLPLEDLGGDLRVLLATFGDAGLEITAEQPVTVRPGQAVALRAAPPPAGLLPGQTARLWVECTRGDRPATDASVCARLIPAIETGYVRWLPGESRTATLPPAVGPVISSSAGRGAAPAAAENPETLPARVPLPAPLVEALYEGTTLWAGLQPADSPVLAFDVPLPDEPGLYRAVFLVRGPAGDTACSSVLLDTRSGLRLSADAPPRLALGDRTLAAVVLENQHAEPVGVRLHVNAGDGLNVESVQLGERVLGPESLGPEAGISLVVPGGGRSCVQMRVEAISVGRGVLAAEVVLPEGRQPAHATYEVLGTDQPAEGSVVLQVKRTVFHLTESEAAEPAPGLPPADRTIGRKTWERALVGPADRVEVGDRLLVREELTLARPLTSVSWSQRVPPNCHADQTSTESRYVADLSRRDLDSLVFAARPLAAGYHLHEYQIIAVRPGVCLLPSPTLSVDGKPVGVLTAPSQVLLNVLAAQGP